MARARAAGQDLVTRRAGSRQLTLAHSRVILMSWAKASEFCPSTVPLKRPNRVWTPVKLGDELPADADRPLGVRAVGGDVTAGVGADACCVRDQSKAAQPGEALGAGGAGGTGGARGTGRPGGTRGTGGPGGTRGTGRTGGTGGPLQGQPGRRRDVEQFQGAVLDVTGRDGVVLDLLAGNHPAGDGPTTGREKEGRYGDSYHGEGAGNGFHKPTLGLAVRARRTHPGH